ncbi:hypothetical protein Tco_1441450 [Tanacetum coccineum]
MFSQVNEARDAKDTLGILFWGVMHKRFGVITSWEEDPEEETEEDHADYPADEGDDDVEPFDDDDDDTDDEDKEPFEDNDDDEEEEEHLAPADSSVVPIVDHVPSAGDTEAFETDESTPTPRS